MLEIRNFSKTYKGGKRAVSNLNLHVQAGDIYGFIGHNGAGKSTTIKAAVGVLEFEEGEILIDGKDIRKSPVECNRYWHISRIILICMSICPAFSI